jgi:quinol monooxygenase YgiN
LILVIARVEAHVAQRRELAQALLQWATAAKSEEGAVEAEVYEDVRAAHTFCLVARWSTRAAFQSHLAGASFGSVTGAVELLAGESAITVSQATDDACASTTFRRLRDSSRHIDSRT